MASLTIYPKKKPGFANIRSGSAVNNGIVNNVLAKATYPAAIGTTTGLVQKAKTENVEYLWHQVKTSAGKIGWIREDAFSYVKNNSETQVDPKLERLRIAQQQAKQTLETVQKLGKSVAALGANYSKLSPQNKKTLEGLAAQYTKMLSRLKSIGAVEMKVQNSGVAGLGILPAIPVVVYFAVTAAAFAGFVIDRALKWYTDNQAIQKEAEQQQQVANILAQAAQSSDPATSRKAVTALETVAKESEKTQREANEERSGSDVFSQITSIVKWGAIGYGSIMVFKLIQAR